MTELSLSIKDRKITATVDSDDLCVGEILEMLRGMLVSHGYIDESFVNTCEEIAKDE